MSAMKLETHCFRRTRDPLSGQVELKPEEAIA